MSLPSSMADFVPCDRLLQKAYCEVMSSISVFKERFNVEFTRLVVRSSMNCIAFSKMKAFHLPLLAKLAVFNAR